MTTHPDTNDDVLGRAARAIAGADALLLAVGSGHDLAGGLAELASSPQAYRAACPVWAELGLGYQDLADVRWFGRDPTLAWALYAPLVHRAITTAPDATWSTLASWLARHDHAFVFTSATGGLATTAGVEPERVYELQGSLQWTQCALPCTETLWPAGELLTQAPEIDAASGRLSGEAWPRCPACGRTARPNVIGVNDWTFVDARVTAQHQRYRRWLADVHAGRLVVVELGTTSSEQDAVRAQAASLASAGATLIRLGATGATDDDAEIRIDRDARDAVAAIDALLTRS